MKRFMLTLLLVLVLFSPSPAQAAEPAKAPDGFRGIKFGTDLSKVSGMIKTGDMFLAATRWVKQDDKLFVGDVACHGITYSSFNNQFFSVDITYGTKDFGEKLNFLKLSEALKNIYGKPDIDEFRDNDGHPFFMKVWQFKNIEVRYCYWETPNLCGGYISYTYLPIQKQSYSYHDRQKQKEYKEAAESLKKDL